MSRHLGTEYTVDPCRLYARVDERTGVFVPAKYKGEVINADICQLSDESIRRYFARKTWRDLKSLELIRFLEARTSSASGLW